LMRKPDFFVVGAAKSGTSAIWKYFQRHKDIFVTKDIANKELGYYSNNYGVNNKEQYLSNFKEANPNQIIGEVCHAYLSSKESADLIKNDIPNAKIIIILRNPVERAYSLYNWMVMEGYENKISFERALKREEDFLERKTVKESFLHEYKENYFYVKSGLYFNQVKKYFDVFGKENVLIIEHKDFKKNQKLYLEKIYGFLNISKEFNFEQNQTNKSKKVLSVYIQYLCRRVMLSKYSKYNVLVRVSKLLMKINSVKSKPKRISNVTRTMLYGKFREDISKLTIITGINFEEKWSQE